MLTIIIYPWQAANNNRMHTNTNMLQVHPFHYRFNLVGCKQIYKQKHDSAITREKKMYWQKKCNNLFNSWVKNTFENISKSSSDAAEAVYYL